MFRNILKTLVVLLLITGCKEDTKIAEPPANEGEALEASFKRVVGDGEYNFQTEYNNRLDTSYLDVLYKGKKMKRYGFSGRIKTEALADLNLDKKNEIYVVVEDESMERIFGYHFEDGQVMKIKKKSLRGELAVSNMTYSIERDQLVERYKLKFEDGQVENRISRFNLVNSGNDYVLLPQGWHPNELKRMGGQYAARDVNGVGYYKMMMLKDIGGGMWNVDIKVKKNVDKTAICTFNGDGYFLDQNLIVPLNSVNAELKGVLKIRFLELQAAVYTEDPKDSKEMVSFCNGVGSIAGNFKKTNL